MKTNTEQVQRAVNLFNNGYSCTQSVVCAFCEELGISHEQGMSISSGFGGGIGGLRRTCGAMTGAVILLGLKYGNYDPTDIIQKREHYQRVKDLEKLFTEKYSTSICKELLLNAKAQFEDSPMARTEEYYAMRPCAIFVEHASRIVQKQLENNDNNELQD